MARLTYSQVKSTASAYIKDKYAEDGSKVDVLIYKDSGGNYNMKPLHNGQRVCYIELKAIVSMNSKGDIETNVSRETIGRIIEEYSTMVQFIYAKFC